MQSTRQRGKYGSGSMTQRAPGVWRLRAYVGDDPGNGNPRQIERTVKGAQKDAAKALAELVTKAQQGQYDHTFEVWGIGSAGTVTGVADAGHSGVLTLLLVASGGHAVFDPGQGEWGDPEKVDGERLTWTCGWLASHGCNAERPGDTLAHWPLRPNIPFGRGSLLSPEAAWLRACYPWSWSSRRMRARVCRARRLGGGRCWGTRRWCRRRLRCTCS
jgi:hypothetical protein